MYAMKSIAIFIFAVASACFADARGVSAASGNGCGVAADKNWDEYLAKMERPAPETGVRRFRLEGIPQKVYYDARSSLEQGSGCPCVRRLGT